MKINPNELTELLQSTAKISNNDARELAALRERVLKLEHKINELYDMLTDFRVNQIMDTNPNKMIWYTPDFEPEEWCPVILYKLKSAGVGHYCNGNYYVYNPLTSTEEVRIGIEFWTYLPKVIKE